MHTNYFCSTIKAVKLILLGYLNWDEPSSSTVLAPKPAHHHEQNIGRMRGLQRLGHLYKAVISASEAVTNRDTHGHQPQSVFLRHMNEMGVIHSAQNECCAVPTPKLFRTLYKMSIATDFINFINSGFSVAKHQNFFIETVI